MPTQTTKMRAPAGIIRLFIDGTKLVPDATGMINVPTALISAAVAAGCVIPHDSGTTASRPNTNLSPGQFYFDATLNKPIWRNAANSGWIDATGTAA